RQFAGIDSTGYSWWFTPRSLASRRQQAVAKLVTVERQRRDNGTLSQFGATPACGAVVRSCRTPLMSSLERRSHLAHEALHLFFRLRVRLQADVEVEDHLREAGGLDLLQRVGDLRGRADEHRVLGEVLGLDLLQALDDLDEIAVARRRGLGIARKGRDHA